MIQTEVTTFEKYPAYKDSGSYWSGQIPEEWNALPIRAIFEERNEKNDGPKTDFILSVTKDRGVIPYDEKGAIGNNKSEEIERYKLVYPNDFVINKMNVVIGSLGMSKYFGAFSQVYLVYKPKSPRINIEYYSYIFSNPSFYKSLIKFCTGIMELRESLNKSDFKKIILPFPSFETQTSIVNFLDDKTSKIDTAIAQKEQMIALLKERKQIVIQNAVTGKWSMVNGKWAETPKEKMKDSGVKWIGEIPEGWEVKKIKHVTSKIGSGVTPSGGGTTYLDEGGVPLLRSQNIHFGRIDLTDVARISQNVHDSMSNSKVRKGDVLLNITGGSIGRCHFVETDKPLNVNQHVCIVRPNKMIETRFLNNLLASNIGQDQIWFYQQGGGREGLNFQALKNFVIPFPPEQERVKIMEFIENEDNKIDQAITLQQSQIEKLKEYKSTLIDSAVTGKIRVS